MTTNLYSRQDRANHQEERPCRRRSPTPAPGSGPADQSAAGYAGLRRGRRGARGDAGNCPAQPDIMILDISLNGPDGLELLKSIRASDPDLPVLILSMHDEAIYAERALRARANGYIMKQEATEKVLVAVRRILNGDVYLSDRMSNKMLQQYIGGAPSMIQSRIASLSDRELEVFRSHWRRPRHPRDCRGTAPQHQDRRDLPGPHQGEARAPQRPRTDPARDPVEDQRNQRLINCSTPL